VWYQNLDATLARSSSVFTAGFTAGPARSAAAPIG
jgi:hypothetical protein